MKKPSKKPARPKSKQKPKRDGHKAASFAMPYRHEVHARSEYLSAPPQTRAPLRFDQFARAYEGIMGTPPRRGWTARSTAVPLTDDQVTVALLSLPVLAMILGLGLTHTSKSRRVVTGPVSPVVLQAPSVIAVLPAVHTLPNLGLALAPRLVATTSLVIITAERAGNAGVSTPADINLVSPSRPMPVTSSSDTPLPLVAAPELRLSMLVPSSIGELGLMLPGDVMSRDAPLNVVAWPNADTSCLAPASFRPALPSPPASASVSPAAFGLALAASARAQTRDFVIYNDTYRSLPYPNGDVQPLFGVCTDVIIRAYRGLGIDLQQLVHDSGIGNGDVSIDHRRTETLRRFFARFGDQLPVSALAEDYMPGDVVTYDRPQNRHSRSHIAMVSDVVAPSGRYMILHNRGWGPQLEDGLFVDAITGHYRYRGAPDRPLVALAAATLPARLTPAKQSQVSVPALPGQPRLTRLMQTRLAMREARSRAGTSVRGLGR